MAMQKITLPPERRAAILRRTQSRPHRLRRTAGRAVLAAVLVVLLTFSAFAAASPALREALQHVLGGFTEQSQPITGVAVEETASRCGRWRRCRAAAWCASGSRCRTRPATG